LIDEAGEHSHFRIERELAEIALMSFKNEDSTDWENLRIFLAVAEAGSLAGAARRLRLSQATVWRRVGALERSLSARLFERHQAGYVLTANGASFLKGLDGLQRTVESAQRLLTNATEAAEGEVRITAPEFAGIMIADGLGRLARGHPRLALELLTGSPAAVMGSSASSMASGMIEIGVRVGADRACAGATPSEGRDAGRPTPNTAGRSASESAL